MGLACYSIPARGTKHVTKTNGETTASFIQALLMQKLLLKQPMEKALFVDLVACTRVSMQVLEDVNWCRGQGRSSSCNSSTS